MRTENLLHKLPRWLGGAGWFATGDRSFKQRVLADDEKYESLFARDPSAPLSAEENAALAPVPAEGEAQSLVDEMLSKGRYALLLRPQLIENLTAEQAAQAQAALTDGMSLVPEGEVILRAAHESDEEAQLPRAPLHVDAYFLDRFAVTNAQYAQFVAAGGYAQMAIWQSEVLPAVLDFVDQTGQPGPRFWRHGRYPRGEDRHPVVGICWYEACAYARWAGKRLPSDAEWVKAGSWPVSIAGQRLLQRRYPWGEAIDRTRANLWGSGPNRTVTVEAFPSGVSVGGAQQLIGNVWEWTADPLLLGEEIDSLPADTGMVKMKSLRGGAFDTYLDCQATCQFQSGDQSLARKHNIGFRCAISMCDISTSDGIALAAESEPSNCPLAEANL